MTCTWDVNLRCRLDSTGFPTQFCFLVAFPLPQSIIIPFTLSGLISALSCSTEEAAAGWRCVSGCSLYMYLYMIPHTNCSVQAWHSTYLPRASSPAERTSLPLRAFKTSSFPHSRSSILPYYIYSASFYSLHLAP